MITLHRQNRIERIALIPKRHSGLREGESAPHHQQDQDANFAEGTSLSIGDRPTRQTIGNKL